MDRKIQELQRFSVSKKVTLQDIALQLGYKSPSSLSMIASGQRLPSKKILNQLFELWKTSKSDRSAIESLVSIESKLKKGKKVLQTLSDLQKTTPRIKFSRIPMDQLDLIKEWYHLVLFEILALPDLKDHEATTIYRKLDRKVSIAQINKALQLFVRSGLIARDSNHENTIRYIRLQDTVGTSEDIPSEAIRSHHKGMITQSLDALANQPVQSRQYSGLTFRVKNEKIPELKKEIQNFFSKIYDEYSDLEGSEIYQMNLQLFSHLQVHGQKTKTKDEK